MAIQPILIPPEWNWAFDLVVGQDWPQADEDALRRLAQYWTDALNGLLGIAHDGNTAAQNVNYSVQAVSSDEFTKYWDAYTDGDDSIIGQMARQAEVLAAELLQFAEQTEFTKLSINIQIVILLIQLVFDAATALISAGATTAEGIVAALITRLTVKNLLTELIKAVVMAVLPDVITQVVMITEGHRSSFDVGETLQAAQMGVIGGLVGAGAGALLGGVGTGIGKWVGTTLGRTIGEDLGTQIGKEAGKVAGAALTGAATNVFTNAATGLVDNVENNIHASIDPEYAKELATQSQNQGQADQKASQNPFTAALNGAFTGVLFHGVHEAGTHFTDSVYQPVEFTTTADNGQTVTYKALPKADGTYAVHTEDYNYIGTGTLDGSTLTVTPSKGNVFQATQAPEHGTTTGTTDTSGTTETTQTTDATQGTAQLADSTTLSSSTEQTASVETPTSAPAVSTDGTAAVPVTTTVTDQPVVPVVEPMAEPVVEPLVEPAVEPVVEPMAEVTTNASVVPPAEAPVVPPAQAPVQAQVEAPVQVQASVEAPVVAPVEAPVVAPVEAPVVAPAQAPVHGQVEAPAQVQAPVEAPVVPPVEAPVVPPVHTQVEPQVTPPPVTEHGTTSLAAASLLDHPEVHPLESPVVTPSPEHSLAQPSPSADVPLAVPVAEEPAHRPFQSGGANEEVGSFRDGAWYKLFGKRRIAEPQTLVHGHDAGGDYVENPATGERFPNVRAAAEKMLQDFADKARAEFGDLISEPDKALRSLAELRAVKDDNRLEQAWKPAQDLATELGHDLPPDVAAALKHIADRPAQARTALADFVATAPEEFRAPVRDLLNATLRDRVAVHDLLQWQGEPGLSRRVLSQHGLKVLERLVDPSNPAVTALLSDSRTADPAVRAVLTDILGADADARRGFVALLDPAARGHLDSFQEAAPAVAAIAILPGQGQDAVFFSTSAKGGEPEHDPFVQNFLDQRRAQLEAMRTEIENQLLDDRRGQVIEAAPRQGRGEPTPEETRYPWKSSDVEELQRNLRAARSDVAGDVDVAEALLKTAARQVDEAVAAKLPAEHVAALRRERQQYEAALDEAKKNATALDKLQTQVEERRQARLEAILKAHPEDGAPLAEVGRLLKQLGHCGEMGACDDAARALRAAMPDGLSLEEQNTRLTAAFHDVVFGAVEIGTHRLTEPGPRALTDTGFVHGTWKEACPNCAAALEHFHGAELNRDGVRIFDEHPPGQSGGGYEGAQEPWTRGEPAASPIRSVQEAQLGAMLMRQFRNGAATMVDRLRTAIAVMAGVDPSELESSFHHDRLNSGTVPADVSVDELIADGNTRELLASFIGAAFGGEDPHRFDKLVLDLAHAGDLERLGAAGLDVKAVHDYIDFLQRRLNHFPEPRDFTDPGNLADFFSPGSDTAGDLRAGSRRTLRPDADDQKYLIPLSELEMNGIGLSSREITDLLARARDNRVIAENYRAGRVPWSTGEARYTPGSLDPDKPSAWFQRNTVEGDMPAVAGPSGTTTRVFAIAKFLRPSADLAGDFAAALTGYLVSSHHHSMSEVVQGLDALHFYDTPESRDNIASALNLDTLYGKVPGLVRHEPTAWVPDPAHPGSLTEEVQPFLHHIEARPPDLLDPAAQLQWARDAYAEIGHNPDAVVKAVVKVLEQVPRADGGVGYSQDEVAAVHSYLFVEEHDLADGLGGTIRAQFDADPEIAAAWQRMASGVVDARDLVLMEHELAEMKHFAEHPGATLLEAHRAANAVANWERTQPYERRQALYDYAKKMHGDVSVVPENGGREPSKPFQSGGHYQGADSDKPETRGTESQRPESQRPEPQRPEPGGSTGQERPRLPGVQKVILEALNGPQQDHYRYFSSNELGAEYGEKTLGAMVRSLSPDVQKAVKQYTDKQWVNEFLRAPNAPDKLKAMQADDDIKRILGRYYEPPMTAAEIVAKQLTEAELLRPYETTMADVQAQVSLIDQAIAASPLPEGLIVHRGLTDIRFMTKTGDPSTLVGKVFTEQGYMSGSLGATPPGNFASREFQLHLRVPKDSHALWLGTWSAGGTQREILLPRGTQYKITEARFDVIKRQWDIYARVTRPGDPSVPWTP